MTQTLISPSGHVDGHPIERRMVQFDWSDTPAHWLGGDAFSSHVVNVLHLLLPPGERWFIEVVNRARPKVKDPELQESIKPFIQQESWHAQAHQIVLDHLEAQGIDSKPFTDRLERMFEGALADHPSWPAPLRDWWGRRNLAAVAAIEHFTAVLGHWILVNDGPDKAGADPEMLDLLRWHGAEEVEHRSLVFDVHEAVGGRWIQRVLTMLEVAPTLALWWVRGVRYLAEHDPRYNGPKPSWKEFVQAGRRGLVPTFKELLGGVPGYLKPGYNPSQDFSTEMALEYIARSPAAQAAMERKRTSGS